MGNFYFVMSSYTPHTAETNRILGYIKYLSESGVKTKVVFLGPDKHFSEVQDQYKNISFEYLWKQYYYSKNKFARVIIRYLYPKLLCRRFKTGDKVYFYGCLEAVHEAVKKKGIKIYQEITELLESIGGRNKITGFPLKKHYIDCKKLDGLFVISNPLKDFYINKGVDSNHIHLVNMTVDTDRFDGLRKEPTKDKYVAYCGHIYNNKDGVDDLIKAMAHVFKVHPEVKLYIIGRTVMTAEKCSNEKLMEDLGIRDNIVMTGEVSDKEMLHLVKNATAMVYNRPDTLRAQTSFSTKLGEFLMTENPVIITSVGDIPLFLKDGVSAIISSPGDNKLFADKVCWVLDHQDKANEIGKNGAQVARISFNSKIVSKGLFDIILK